MFSEVGTTPIPILKMKTLKLKPLDGRIGISTKKCGYEIISQELVQEGNIQAWLRQRKVSRNIWSLHK